MRTSGRIVHDRRSINKANVVRIASCCSAADFEDDGDDSDTSLDDEARSASEQEEEEPGEANAASAQASDLEDDGCLAQDGAEGGNNAHGREATLATDQPGDATRAEPTPDEERDMQVMWISKFMTDLSAHHDVMLVCAP